MARKPIETAVTEKGKLDEFTSKLPCVLTTDELIDRGHRLAQLSADLGAHNAHAEAVKKELKSKEAQIEEEAAGLAMIIRDRTERREVQVEAWADYIRNRYYELRVDTGEIVPGSERALRAEEKQGVLPLHRARQPAVPPTLDEQRAARQKELENKGTALLEKHEKDDEDEDEEEDDAS